MASSPKPAVIAPSIVPKIATPAPLGLAAFGVTTVVLCSIHAGILPPEATPAVVPLAFAFGGLAQLIVGLLEFKNGNTFGTVAFTAYGAFWLWYSTLLWTVGAGWLKPPAAAGVGAVLFLWVTFFLLAGGDFGWKAGKRLGGVVGLVTGFVALYVSFAEVLNATLNREAIPLGRPVIE